MDFSGNFFTAEYRDGQVYYDGKTVPAGHFAVQLMNEFYDNDTAARICVFHDSVHYRILEQLRDGYLDILKFGETGKLHGYAFETVPRLTPFQFLDETTLQETVAELFSDESCREICDYFRYRGQIAEIEEDEVCVGTVDRVIDREYMRRIEDRIHRIKDILLFVELLSEDLYITHERLREFVAYLDEAERLDEAHLLPLALEIFGEVELPYSVQYIAAPVDGDKDGVRVSRRLSFDRFASFIITDFFEELHYGHYPRRCPICRKYFLMQSPRRQIYCPDGYAPELYRGKRLTCRNYAAVMRRKELASDDPIIDLYNRRCAAIRAEKSRGVITPAFAETARLLAQDRKFLAIQDEYYANTQYPIDLSREKLYADAEARETS